MYANSLLASLNTRSSRGSGRWRGRGRWGRGGGGRWNWSEGEEWSGSADGSADADVDGEMSFRIATHTTTVRTADADLDFELPPETKRKRLFARRTATDDGSSTVKVRSFGSAGGTLDEEEVGADYLEGGKVEVGDGVGVKLEALGKDGRRRSGGRPDGEVT